MKSTQKNMKCTWPTPARVGVGSNANYSRRHGLRWLQDTNMLVSPTQNSGVGGIAQRQPLTPSMLRRSGIWALEFFPDCRNVMPFSSWVYSSQGEYSGTPTLSSKGLNDPIYTGMTRINSRATFCDQDPLCEMSHRQGIIHPVVKISRDPWP